MTGKIHDAFDTIQASNELKVSTMYFLQNEREKRQYYKKYPGYRNVLAAVCVLLMLTVGIGSYSIFQTPVSYISIDVNPSVELTLNRFDRVVSAVPYNEDGQLVLDGLVVKGKHYTDAIDQIVEGEAMGTYLSDRAALTFTVASQNSSKENELITKIERSAGCMSYRGRCTNADVSTVNKAHDNGLSLGKYTAYLELSQYDDSITVEDCKHMSMANIHHQISTHKNGEYHSNQENREADRDTGSIQHKSGHHKRMHGEV